MATNAEEEHSQVTHNYWEYLVVEQSTACGPWLIDDHGRDGWELVAAIRATETVDRLWFKRPATTAKKRGKGR